MNALILDGFLSDADSSHNVHCLVLDALSRFEATVKKVILRKIKIAPCSGCFNCWIKTPGECIVPDAGRDIAKEIVDSDLLVFFSPVTFGGYSSELKKALDRIIPIISPFFLKINNEVHHRPRYEKYPRLAGIGVLPHADRESERIFKALVSRNAINFHSPSHAACVLSLDQNPHEMHQEIEALFAQEGFMQ